MRYIFALLVCIIMALQPARSQTGWLRIESGVTNDLMSIEFTSETTGYVVGSENTALNTTDGGSTWHSMTLPGIDNRWTLTHVEFPSTDIGFITGYRRYDSYFSSALFRTTDHGNTWNQVQLKYDTHFFYRIAFPSPRIGYLSVSTADAGGDTIVYGTIILKTTDAGITWYESYRESDRMGGSEIVFRDTSHGIVVRSSLVEGFTDHFLLTTSDGGTSWQSVNPCPDSEHGCPSLSSLAYVGGRTWLISNNSMSIFRSTDDGATWTGSTDLLPFPTLESILDIRLVDSLSGYACGSPRTELFRTTDGGLSWSSQQSNADEKLFSISTPSKKVAYACGTNGRIVKTLSGGSLQSDGEGDRTEEVRLSITPNTRLATALIIFPPSLALQQLIIYDIDGKVVRRVPVSTGISSLTLSIAGLPSGTYWCSLGDETTRFVVLR